MAEMAKPKVAVAAPKSTQASWQFGTTVLLEVVLLVAKLQVVLLEVVKCAYC